MRIIVAASLLFTGAIAPAQNILAGRGSGPTTDARLFNAGTGTGAGSFIPFAANFTGGATVAVADVNADGVHDYVVGTATGGNQVRVFSGSSGAVLQSFFAYDQSFTGGVFVAAGDIDGDGRADIITGAGAGASGGHVKVFSGATGSLLSSFFAFDGFSGGVRVATGDVNGDGTADIIAGTGNGSSQVKVFSGTDQSLLRSFFGYSGFSGGVFVASGDVDGDGRADIITGADSGAPGGHVKVFDGTTNDLDASFFAYGPSFSGGVRVAASDVDGDGRAEIVTGSGVGSAVVKVFDNSSFLEQLSFASAPGTEGVYVGTFANPVPEPATLLALGVGVAVAARRRKRT